MQFDFLRQYQTLSNVELLKIINSEADYDPKAVEAGYEILKYRHIEEWEQQEVNEYFEALQLQEEKQKQKREKLHSFFRVILEPGNEKLNPLKWYYFLLLIVGLQCAAALYRNIVLFIFFLHCYTCSLRDLSFSGSFFDLFLIILIFCFLIAKLRIGWILLFANILLAVAFETVELFQYVFNSAELQTGIVWFAVFYSLRIALLWLLRTDNITSFFGVTFETKRQTLIYSSIFAVIAVTTLVISY
jgi:hypothetical protein